MKLSILIPIYNFDVTEFISELHKQSRSAGVEFEMLCFDDASEDKFKIVNRKVSFLDNVRYVELKENLGRSKIRNLLAKEAKSENLLFFDCDSKLTSRNFVKNYLENTFPGSVVYGGRSYEKNPPLDKNKILRWFYGVNREFVPVKKRKKNPYKYFLTNNFLIPQDIFFSIKMNEDLYGYGHEDTVFAQELKRKKIPIEHIDNPLCHIGLEDTGDFLAKTQQGISNLGYLISNNLVDKNVKIFRYYYFVKKFYLKFIVKFIFTLFQKQMKINLKSGSPKLANFDFLKLYWLIMEMDGRENSQRLF